MRPFRLLIGDHQGTTIRTWNGSSFDGCLADVPSDTPGIWASSGLGDAPIEAARRARFATLVSPNPTPEQQDCFHADRHGADGAAWVRMDRVDARSVSLTTVTLTADSVSLATSAISEAGACEPASSHKLAILGVQRVPPRKTPGRRL